jgi:DNA-binding transcriptional LysR family regulator
MNVTLRQLRAFVAVAQRGHFARAASDLSVTPSALSMLIRQLEIEIGARVFDRHTRQVRLTEMGENFLPVAAKTLADLDHALTQSRQHASLQRGRVSVAAAAVLAATTMPWAIQRFRREHPGITMVLRDVVEQQIRQHLRGGDVDLGVGTALEIEADIDEAPLFEDRLVALLPANHLLARRPEIAWRELGAQPLIVLGRASPLRVLAERAFAANDVAVAPAYEASFSSTIISMVANGMGVAALPINANQVSPRVRVAIRPLVRPVVPRRVCLFKRHDRELSPAASAFAQFLLGFVKDGDYPGKPVALRRSPMRQAAVVRSAEARR